ncbi:NADPH:quinone oxidoreductase family protein [Amycolatopsis thermoflava]|uniref:NADPH:quinone reductase-like Zn-dependent oxidoreductase n=1 Tax=Amycolatopsis thermoflava TaxID=84480 RepID=A0A3N2H5L7_9PSEU|nr:NADPH:quinone oxidoreductase family protein [Amycolatopsis thermoflava]ROS44207.1 NADPH:quinone reductase-like Zn-dependent oxidoreductase [Amycolatopsis thermoflava]
MRALVCTRLGELDVLDVPSPSPGPGEVVVEVSHIGLNFHDTLVVAGTHVVRPELPFSPGSEYAGTVVAVGAGVTSVRVGDRVAGNEEYGCAREAVVVRADRVTVLPEHVTDQQAAAILVTYSTAYHALVQRAGLRPGETLAVLGAAGGVGSAAVDVGNLLGAKVIAGASTAERANGALRYGAHETFSYGGTDAKAAIKELTGGGADVVFDPVGGAVGEAAVRAIAWAGRYLVVGFASGDIPRVGLNIPLVKGASVVGVFFGEFVRRARAVHEANLRVIFDWAGAGRLRHRVHDVLPLEEGPRALRDLAAGKVEGKLLLRVTA